jgi:pimeloyl-ACP methyl ester carboxylesterase
MTPTTVSTPSHVYIPLPVVLHTKHYPGGARPLLVLHGFLGSGGNWSTLSRTAFSTVRDTYALDARNHGRSPHTEAFSYAHMAADVRAFMDAQGIQTADVLGHSMGGKTAMTLALTYPNRVRSVVVADMAPRAYPPGHDALLTALQSVDLGAVDSRSDADERLADSIPDWGVRQFLLKNLTRTPNGYEWAPNLGVLAARYDEILKPVLSDTSYDGPALFVRGGASPYVRDADWPQIQTLFPHARLVTIPDAGHWVHAQAPQPFADAVLAFLQE